MKATEQNFPVMFIMLYKVVRMFEVCGWNPNLWPYNENFWTVLSCVQELLLCFTRPFQSLEFLRTSNVIIHLKCSSSSLIWFRFPQSIAKYIFDAWFDWFWKWNKYQYKKHNHVDIMCFSIIKESISNFVVTSKGYLPF